MHKFANPLSKTGFCFLLTFISERGECDDVAEEPEPVERGGGSNGAELLHGGGSNGRGSGGGGGSGSGEEGGVKAP
jgi:hypothetical protein